jgi:hypothetical protein
MLYVWLFVAALVLLPVVLRIWAEEGPDNETVHHSGDENQLDAGTDDEDPDLTLAV